jgi:NAD-dependent deacetylase
VAPNAAHQAIASLEVAYDVVVITHNVDELHELAGSTQIMHLHGQLAYARGTANNPKRYRMGADPIALGQLSEDGTQLRPDIVWFGEETQHMEEARQHVASASKVLVVGTSLPVFPAASLVKSARGRAQKVLNCLAIDRVPYGFEFLRGKATTVIPRLTQKWLSQAR